MESTGPKAGRSLDRRANKCTHVRFLCACVLLASGMLWPLAVAAQPPLTSNQLRPPEPASPSPVLPVLPAPDALALEPDFPDQSSLAGGVKVQECVVRFGEELNLPTTEAGLIAELNVTVGQTVGTETPVARLDDRSLKIRSRAALLRLTAAQEQAADDVELRYAQTARAEAQAELDSSRAVYNESSGAVPLVNIRRLRLAVERAELEVARAHQAVRQTQIEADLRAADVALLEDTLRRFSLTSPIDGVVLQVYKQRGEWVAAGDAVVRLARLDRLQVQALLSAEMCLPNDCLNQPVAVHWHDPTSGEKLYLRGRVTAVLPQRLAGGRYRIQAEIANRPSRDGKGWQLHPGTEVEMAVYPPAAALQQARRTVAPTTTPTGGTGPAASAAPRQR